MSQPPDLVMEGSQPDIALETPPDTIFMAPSLHAATLLSGASYTHFSPLPATLTTEPATPCVLGVDEAGRGPVLGPMVYGLFYLAAAIERPLLAETHHFDDSKVLTPATRTSLMTQLCTPATDLFERCGWAVEVMSARDIGANMMKPNGAYNLNAQAMDATVKLIHGVYERGVNVTEIYIDTIGQPEAYQRKLERVFPRAKITVAKKADSLYPCVSAASVVAKVTRDAALEVLSESYGGKDGQAVEGWGSGYPSDARCTGWMKRNMDPTFGWGSECRFSWGTVKDLLDVKGAAAKVDWPVEEDDETTRLTSFFSATDAMDQDGDEMTNWFGSRVTSEVF